MNNNNIEDKLKYLSLLKERDEYYATHKIDLFFQDETQYYDGETYLARHFYKKYLQWFAAGKYERKRVAFCGNQIGKTSGLCAFEVICHLTGIYPHWWEGHRFDYPNTWLIAGASWQTVRDVLQVPLFGDTTVAEQFGTGLIPLDRIINKTRVSGADGAIGQCWIKFQDHKKPSKAVFRCYEQGRKAAEGIVVDGLWTDEEPGSDFLGEAERACFKRRGKVMMSFTPLAGYTEVVASISPEGDLPVFDPHLYEKEVNRMLMTKKEKELLYG